MKERYRLRADVLEVVNVDACIEVQDADGEWHVVRETTCAPTLFAALARLGLDALQRYGAHTLTCYADQEAGGSCTCGLAEAMDDPAPPAQEPR